MRPVVLDSSMSLTWCLPEQTNPVSLRMLERVLSQGALVPVIWHLEMANILGLKLRSANLTRSEVETAGTVIDRLHIVTDETSTRPSMQHLLSLMARINLTMYDTTYVDLAMRSGASLATFDKAMTAVALQNGIAVNRFS